MTDEGFGDWLGKQMARCGFGSNVDLEREAGLGNTTISRWRNGVMAPSVDQLRKLERPLQTPLLELLVRAGILSPQEAKMPREALQKSAHQPVIKGVADAIREDADLLDQARQHLLNQYRMLIEWSEGRGSTAPKKRATPARIEPSLRAAARRGKPDRT